MGTVKLRVMVRIQDCSEIIEMEIRYVPSVTVLFIFIFFTKEEHRKSWSDVSSFVVRIRTWWGRSDARNHGQVTPTNVNRQLTSYCKAGQRESLEWVNQI